jgi:hypothetical protein
VSSDLAVDTTTLTPDTEHDGSGVWIAVQHRITGRRP